jgi:hypothetical protein
MSNPFFDHPILNSPDERPLRHWELDSSGQPTQRIIEQRRRAEFITPIPKPKKRKALGKQLQSRTDASGPETRHRRGQNHRHGHVDCLANDQLRPPTCGRWAFAEFTEVCHIGTDFAARVESEFNKMIEIVAP